MIELGDRAAERAAIVAWLRVRISERDHWAAHATRAEMVDQIEAGLYLLVEDLRPPQPPEIDHERDQRRERQDHEGGRDAFEPAPHP